MDAPESPRQLLAQSISAGHRLIGQILLSEDYCLRHVDDAGRDDLEISTDPITAREIARYDENGNYRPLKSAPNLRRGWLIRAGSMEGLETALEFFYPSALGLWFSSIKETLHPTPLRETLERQTGMYRVTQLLRDDQARELIHCHCNSAQGCLRSLLWEIAPGVPINSLPRDQLSLAKVGDDRIPLICREACNLLVAAARPIAKGNLPKKEES
jgi:sirohydrochlorin cobaltochelatase